MPTDDVRRFLDCVAVTFDVETEGTGGFRVSIFDASGRRVAGVTGNAWSGRGSASWNGNDELGRPAGSGVYFARLEGYSGPKATAKIVLSR